MTAQIEDRVLDYGLRELTTNATSIYLCAVEPTTYAIATGIGKLGAKVFGAGNVCGAPTAGSAARKVSTTAVIDGSVTADGIAGWWAVTDDVNSRLLVHERLAENKLMAKGNIFTLDSFDISIPNHA